MTEEEGQEKYESTWEKKLSQTEKAGERWRRKSFGRSSVRFVIFHPLYCHFLFIVFLNKQAISVMSPVSFNKVQFGISYICTKWIKVAMWEDLRACEPKMLGERIACIVLVPWNAFCLCFFKLSRSFWILILYLMAGNSLLPLPFPSPPFPSSLVSYADLMMVLIIPCPTWLMKKIHQCAAQNWP